MTSSSEARFKTVENRRDAFTASEQAVDSSLNSLSANLIEDSQWAVFCFDVQDLIEQGCDFFKSINHLDEDWRGLIYAKTLPFDATYENRITDLYRVCLEYAEKSLAIFDRIKHDFCARGHETGGVKELRSAVVEIRGILTADEKFFTGPALLKLQNEAVSDFHKGSTFDVG